MTGFSATGEALTLRTISSTKVIWLTKSQCDSREMAITHIKDGEVIFASAVLGYRVYQSSQMNSVSRGVMHVGYQIIKEDATYDICEMIQSQFMVNIERIKKDKKQSFKYGSLMVCIFFYVQIFFPGKGNVVWSQEKPIMVQIGEMIKDIGNKFGETMWGYFKEFQIRMHKREIIPSGIVRKYKDNICFLVDIDCCIIQAIQPRNFWVSPMGYEVVVDLVKIHVNMLLSKLVDSKAKRFGTCEEASSQIK